MCVRVKTENSMKSHELCKSSIWAIQFSPVIHNTYILIYNIYNISSACAKNVDDKTWYCLDLGQYKSKKNKSIDINEESLSSSLEMCCLLMPSRGTYDHRKLSNHFSSEETHWITAVGLWGCKSEEDDNEKRKWTWGNRSESCSKLAEAGQILTLQTPNMVTGGSLTAGLPICIFTPCTYSDAH